MPISLVVIRYASAFLGVTNRSISIYVVSQAALKVPASVRKSAEIV